MLKYFNNWQNTNDLRKEYLKLIKKYHPDLAKVEEQAQQFNAICAEINNEYELICRTTPKSSMTKGSASYSRYASIINGNEDAEKACNDIENTLSKMVIDYRFYHVYENAKWWEDEIASEINSTIELFWSLCFAKNITGYEFAKLFELCNFDVEKMRRTIMFLSTGAISENDIHTNLTSSNPVPFFDDNVVDENLPNYNSLLLFSKDYTREETLDAWVLFCQRQRDLFTERFYDFVVPKIS